MSPAVSRWRGNPLGEPDHPDRALHDPARPDEGHHRHPRHKHRAERVARRDPLGGQRLRAGARRPTHQSRDGWPAGSATCGQRTLFVAGFVVFARTSLASLACGLATNPALRIVFRAPKGLGAALHAENRAIGVRGTDVPPARRRCFLHQAAGYSTKIMGPRWGRTARHRPRTADSARPAVWPLTCTNGLDWHQPSPFGMPCSDF